MEMFKTIAKAWKIDDIRKKIIYTLLMLVIFRIGSNIPVPGIDRAYLDQAINNQEGLFALFDLFSGGAFSNFTIFALSITPYITASIILQLLTIAIPALERLAREGQEGQKKIAQYTRYLTVVLAFVQAIGVSVGLFRQALISTAFFDVAVIVLVLSAGTAFLMWLGEKINENGIGNGISLIIMVGIIARLPYALTAEIGEKLTANAGGGLLLLIVELVVLFFVFVAAIALVQAVRKVPVQYAKRVIGNKQYGGVRQYIPMKINAAGVMPIIFAQALMLFPMIFSQFDATRGFAAVMSNYTGFWYNFTFAILVVLFTYFYTAVTVNPTMMADDMRKNGGFIPGVKPGKKTAEYLDTIMSRVTLPGSIFLALIAILPAFAMLCGVNNQFASFYGGTSLLILVGVVLDTLQQIESHLLMRHYDGLMKTGRLKGRSGM